MIVYGRNPVRESLRGRRKHAAEGVWATAKAAAACRSWLGGVAVREVAVEEVRRRSQSDAHQGICAEVGAYPYSSGEELLRGEQPLVVVLDQVQDPQNLGSICRTVECVGASGVVIPQRRAAEVTPAVCKASAGAVEHIRIARVTNVADFLGVARKHGCWTYGASTDVASVPYDRPDYSGGVVLVMGGEGEGLRPRVAATCDQLIALPLRGRIGSLGVAAATSAILYEITQGRS